MKTALAQSFTGLSQVSPVASLKNTSQYFAPSKKYVHYKDNISQPNESLLSGGAQALASNHQRSKTQLMPLLKASDRSPALGKLGRFPSTDKAMREEEKALEEEENRRVINYRKDKFHELEMEKAGEQGIFDPKVSVDALDKWLNRMTLSKTNFKTDSPIIGMKKEEKSNDDERYNPAISSRIVDSIFNDKEFKERAKFFNELSPIQERKPNSVQQPVPAENPEGENGDESSIPNAKRPMKSMHTKLAELNKKIINDVVFDQMKVRAIKSDSKPFPGAFVKSSLQSFKNITKILDQPNVVDFRKIFSKIDIIKEAPRSIFDGLKAEEEKLKKDRQPLKREENLHLKDYAAIVEAISSKKGELNRLRKTLYTLTARIKSQQELKSQILHKLLFMEELGDKQHTKEVDKVKSPKLKGRINYQGEKKTLEDFMKMQKYRQERENQEAQLDKMIVQSQEEWKKVLHLTSDLEKELVSLRLEKNRIKVIIKDLYQNMVKGTSERSLPALPTIIRGLWSIKETYTDNIFPEWIDEISRSYVYEMARKEQTLERLQKEKTDMSQSISTLNNPHSLRQTLPKKMEEVQHRLKEIRRVKKKVEIPKGGLEWAKMNEEERALLEDFIKEHNRQDHNDGNWQGGQGYEDDSDSEHFRENLFKKVEMENELKEKIDKLSEEIEELKLKEAKRLYDIFMDPNKYTKDSKDHLFRIFKSLFGLRESEVLVERMFKEKKRENLKNKARIDQGMGANVSNIESRISNANSFWDSSTDPEAAVNRISKEESRIRKKFAFLSPRQRNSKLWKSGSMAID